MAKFVQSDFPTKLSLNPAISSSLSSDIKKYADLTIYFIFHFSFNGISEPSSDNLAWFHAFIKASLTPSSVLILVIDQNTID